MIYGMDWLEKRLSSLTIKVEEIPVECKSMEKRNKTMDFLREKAYERVCQSDLLPHCKEYNCAINLKDDQSYKNPQLYPKSK
jgi:hypothetical protein